VQAHYRSFLAGCYPWINRGIDEQVRKNQKFFSSHTVTPRDNRVAIDHGAGCGFQSIPLALPGFSVMVVDFALPLSQHSYILILEYSRYGTYGP